MEQIVHYKALSTLATIVASCVRGLERLGGELNRTSSFITIIESSGG